MKNKIFTRIIITTLLCAFLTFNVGKVTRISAVGTTAAVAAAAALATGLVFISYVSLTGGSVMIPAASEVEDWLTDIGNKVSKYPIGQKTFRELYQKAATYTANPFLVLEDTFTWTSEKLVSFVNTFSSTAVMAELMSYYQEADLSQPTNGYNYAFTFQSVPLVVTSQLKPFSDYLDDTYVLMNPGANVVYRGRNGLATLTPTNIYGEVRNRYTDGMYYPEVYRNGSWVYPNTTAVGIRFSNGSSTRSFIPDQGMTYYIYSQGTLEQNISGAWDWPAFPNAPIYVSATDEYLPVETLEGEVVETPTWTDNVSDDDQEYPVVPYVKLPSGGNWGFNLNNLLDSLEDLARTLIDIGLIGELFNDYKDSITNTDDDIYYIYYDDSSYTYYTITNYDNDYITYNINVSDTDEHLPVDLNTIQTYSNNRYLEQIKQSALNGSSIVRDLAVFWYDVDPEVTYIALGICIVILLGAFTGKLGHS